jgi:DNA-binding response OmpR family regulator
VIAIDMDVEEFDCTAICDASRKVAPVAVLAVMEDPIRAPVALRAGCHAILLKPFSLNLASARIGRLCRELPSGETRRPGATPTDWGITRTWPDVYCPQCRRGSAVCFEYSSHRRSWFACLGCEHVWLGPRRE